jgi:hypothetical protein
MSSFPILNDEQWLKLLENVAETYNEVTLSRGFNYFKQQRVTSLIISELRVVQARVEGSEDYKITLNLDKLRSSHCTCPVHASCKHLAAVIMELGDRLGYPASQVVNAKHHLKRASTISASALIAEQLPNMDVPGWHAILNQFTSHIKPSYDQGIYMDMLRHHFQSIRKASIPFTDMDLIFFELHQELFILRKIKEQQTQGGVSYYTSFTVYRIYDDIHAWLKQKSAAVNVALAGERLEQTFVYLRQQMAEESGHKHQNYGVYTVLWKYWVAPNSEAGHWMSQEVDALEKLTSDSPSYSLSAAKAFLYLQQDRSIEAWEILEASGTLKGAPADLLLPFLNHLSDTQNWMDLVDWLKRSVSFFYGQKTKELEAYTGYWKAAVGHLPQAEEHMWSTLEELLPHSYRIIEEVLYEQRKWKPWVEMQILQGHDPLYHRVSILQPIEKESPKLLVPYYHQAVNHYVGLKNRHDYKSAVKLLKRLEKVYKKLQQTNRWKDFISDFVERHSRLRALQEELRKGKLWE